MDSSERDFQVLDALDRNEITTQRQLAHHAGISLGQVNYVLKSLIAKGLIKLGNFNKNPDKISYAYLLTPKGMEEKSKLAVRFVAKKIEEYKRLRSILLEKLAVIEEKGLYRVVIVGPEIIVGFLTDLIHEMDNNVVVVGKCERWSDLDQYTSEVFDSILLFDGSYNGIHTISENIGIPSDKLIPLW